MIRLPFEALFERRTSWKLSQLQSWAQMGLGGGQTDAGVTVTETTAEGLPVVFACVRVISSAVAQLPFKLYRRADNRREEAIDHPLYEVLHDLPNPEMTAFDFRALLQAHLLLWGNAYAEIVRNARGEVTALWPLLPWRMMIDRDEQRRLRFTYSHDGGRQSWLYDPARPPILRLMINSLDGLTGRSVVRVLRESLGLSLATERFGASFFKNGTRFGGILTAEDRDFDPTDEDAEEIRKQVEALHASPDKAFRLLVLGGAWKHHPVGMPLEDAQFIETQKFKRSELAGAFGVPEHMIGAYERATFSNVEHESIRWLRDGLDPHLVNWESATRRDCLGPRSFATHYTRFTRAAAVRGDLKSQSEALATQRQNGVINANEWRALLEMDPISEADGGNVYIVNSAARPTTSQPDDPNRT